MAPLVEITHGGALLSVVLGRIRVKFAVVPEVAGSLGTRSALAEALGIRRGGIHGKVLAVTAAARRPVSLVSRR